MKIISAHTDLEKGQKVTINGYKGVFKVASLTARSNIRFVNIETGERVLLSSFNIDQFIRRI